MKLCIVTPSVIKGDGQGRANYEIVKEAIRRKHHVTVLTSRLAPELQQSNSIHWIPIAVKGYPTQFVRNLIFSQKSAFWLEKNRSELDLVQVYGAVTKAIGDVNTAQFVHSAWLKSPVHPAKVRSDLHSAYQWLYTTLNARWEKQAFQQARAVVAVSDKVKQELIDIGVPQERIRVIFNGVDLEEFFPGTVSRQDLGLPEAVPLALFVGDIRINRKNLDTVLHALALVPDLHLAVVGSLEGSPYPKLAEKLKLTQRVHFLGYRRDVAQIMQAADFFVFPSRYEPYGMVVIEAMASGLPVVTAATTGAAEVVVPECGVVLPDSEDQAALAQALETLTNHSESRKQMGQVGRSIAEQHSWTSKAKSYVDLFEELIIQ